jgi:hypothetical protein
MPKKRERGRPTTYSKAVAAKFCAAIAEGNSVRAVCKDTKQPGMTTVFRWLGDPKLTDFRKQYARACEARADAFAEQLLDISDDATNDYMEKVIEGEVVGYVTNGEAIQRSKLRAETRRWLMSKVQPKKYGDKLDLTSGDEPIVPVAIFDMRAKPVAPAPKAKKKPKTKQKAN